MKRILCFTVAVLLAIGMLPVVAFSAGDYSLGSSGDISDFYYPGEDIQIRIYNGSGTSRKQVTRAEATANKLGVTIKASSNSKKVVDTVAIAYDTSNNAFIRVRLVDEFVSTKEQEFALTLTLTENKSNTNATYEIDSEFGNEVNYLQSGEDYFNAEGSPLMEAEGSINKIEVDMGSGISIISRMSSGKRYYASVSLEPTSADDDVMDKYRDIEEVYNLTTINMNGTSNKVRFDLGERYHVYNSSLEHLGTTREDLPYYTKYYVSLKELNASSSSSSSSSSAASGSDNLLGSGSGTSSGGGLLGSGGINPDTGVTGYANVAAVTGIISLAVAGAAALKRPRKK